MCEMCDEQARNDTSESAKWTEADQAYADFVSEIACEVSASEDDVYSVLGALAERGLFSVSEAAALMLAAAQAQPGQNDCT